MLLGCGCNCEQQPESSNISASVSASSYSIFPSDNFSNSTNEDPPYGNPCTACQGLVIALEYAVDIGPMTAKPPTIVGDFGCIEMFNNQPWKTVQSAANGWPWGLPGPSQAICPYWDGESNLSPGTKAGCITWSAEPNSYCGTKPQIWLHFFTFINPVTQDIDGYQTRCQIQFQVCVTDAVIATPFFLVVEYRSEIQPNKIACLNQQRLEWFTAYGNFLGGDELGSWGIGPGNNRSYANDRADFPQFMTVRPWGT